MENDQDLSRREIRRKRKIRNQITAYISIAIIIVVIAVGGFFGIKKLVSVVKANKEAQKLEEEQATAEQEATSEVVQEEQTEVVEEYTEDDLLNEVVDSCLSEMSLEDKVAGLFMITPEALTEVDVVTKAGDGTKESLSTYPVGGLVYFAQNIKSEEQFKTMLSTTSDMAKYPLFLGIDEEGGKVSRVANSSIKVDKVASAGEIGKSGDSGQAYSAMQTIATYMMNYGLNLNFAPVGDVLVDRENTTIGERSYGTDAAVVGEMVSKAVGGLQDTGVSACVKHFPGLGDTSKDTHNEMATTNRTKEEMMETEFQAFSASIAAGTDMIMVSHLSAPSVIGDNTPSSLSSVMIQDILRGELGYDGIVITDALNMGAITEYYTSAEVAVKTLQAGADMILMPENFSEAYQGVLDAVKDGSLTEDQITKSLERIYRVKYRGVLTE